MKVSKAWLKELVEVKDMSEVVRLLPLRTIAIKVDTPDYFELDMKGYNRADLLSMRGVAYEVAATTDFRLLFKEILPPELYWNELTNPEDRGYKFKEELPKLDVEINNRDLCPVYCLVKIEALRVGPSPKEWIQRLEESGMRSVNNVTDVTNLIMLEYGQPLHAFDADKVKDEKIIVRTAQKGEDIETLDSKRRILESSDLLIADSDKALGIAGVMGGKNSEISDSTTTILLEAAIFDPKNLRKTATRLGLISEAGRRFYHGLTLTRLYQALDAAIRMYEELGGNPTGFHIERVELKQWSDPSLDPLRRINLSLNKTRTLIGVDISEQDIKEFLTKLGCGFITQRNIDNDIRWVVQPPYWRLDLEIEEDLIEEVARMYGYEKIPAKPLAGDIPPIEENPIFGLIHCLKQVLVETGLTEVQTYSFYSTDILKNLDFAPNHLDTLVKVTNPISSETEFMRMVIWHNLLEVTAKNYKRGFKDIAIFEVGKVYSPKTGGFEEDYDLGVALLNETDNPVEELYQIVKELVKKLGKNLDLGDKRKDEFEYDEFHPNRFQHLLINGQKAGKIAEVNPRVSNGLGLDKRVAVAEIPIKALL